MEVNFNSRYDENLARSTSDAVFSVHDNINITTKFHHISRYISVGADRLAQSVQHQTFYLRVIGSSTTLDELLKFVFFAQDIMQHKSRQRIHKVISTRVKKALCLVQYLRC